MSNIGPLTTTFTAPGDCAYPSVNIIASPTLTSTYYNYVGKVWPSPLRCFPSGYPNAYPDRFSNYYSPGICPSGWKAYPTSDFPDPAETTALCCPPGFIATGSPSNLFASSFQCFTTHIASTPGTAFIISGTIDIATKSYGDNPSDLITSSNFVEQATGWSVFGIQVRYRAADFLPHNSTSTTSSSAMQATSNSNTASNSQNLTQASPAPAATTQSSAQSSPAGNTTSDSSALSNGAKIGIGVGVPLAVILVATILAFIFIRRRRQRLSQQPVHANDTLKPLEGHDEHKAELPGNKPGISGGERYTGKAELPVTVHPSELEDSNSGWPLPSHGGINTVPTDVDTISSIHGTTHSNTALETVSPPETSRSYVPGEEPFVTGAAAEEQVKYRYIDEEPKVKKQRSRGEF